MVSRLARTSSPRSAGTRTKAAGNPTTVEEYLSAVPVDQREALERLRRMIRAAAPTATEVFRYRMPVFEHQGLLVGLAAQKSHLSFYVMSPSVLESHAADLSGFDVGKGCIRFQASRPIPDSLVKMVVRDRVAENEDRGSA
jgi:uncharacterized protein YdhG (YjbR/CyaY superfamily)